MTMAKADMAISEDGWGGGLNLVSKQSRVSVVVLGASVRDAVGGCKFGKDNITVRVVSNWNEMSGKEKV